MFAINNIGLINQNGFLNTSFYSGTEVTILNLFFNCLLTIILLVVTGHIVDKKRRSLKEESALGNVVVKLENVRKKIGDGNYSWFII